MNTLFRSTTVLDAPQLISFFAHSFSVTPQAEFLRPDLLHWKLWTKREDYSEPRSYVFERGGEILAHAGIWPMTVMTDSGELRGCHLFDWASDARVLGAGVALLKHISEMFDFVFAIGGSEMTQRIIPSIGFKKIGEAWCAARPLRAVRQMLSHQRMNWKIPARLVRNAVWSVVPPNPLAKGWFVEEVPEKVGLDWQFSHAAVYPFYPLRPASFFRYLRCCPTAEVRPFEMKSHQRILGYLVLSVLHHQARVAGVWFKEEPSPQNLHLAYDLAQQAAEGIRAAFEIVASGSTKFSEQAAVSAGLRICKYTPVYMLSRRSDVFSVPLEFQLADTDAVFMSDGTASYWT